MQDELEIISKTIIGQSAKGQAWETSIVFDNGITWYFSKEHIIIQNAPFKESFAVDSKKFKGVIKSLSDMNGDLTLGVTDGAVEGTGQVVFTKGQATFTLPTIDMRRFPPIPSNCLPFINVDESLAQSMRTVLPFADIKSKHINSYCITIGSTIAAAHGVLNCGLGVRHEMWPDGVPALQVRAVGLKNVLTAAKRRKAELMQIGGNAEMIALYFNGMSAILQIQATMPATKPDITNEHIPIDDSFKQAVAALKPLANSMVVDVSLNEYKATELTYKAPAGSQFQGMSAPANALVKCLPYMVNGEYDPFKQTFTFDDGNNIIGQVMCYDDDIPF